MNMKLVYKIGGIGLAGGASAGAYLLISSSKTEPEVAIQSIDDAPQPSAVKVNAKWEATFTDKGYEPLVSFGDTTQLLGLLDAYKNENNIHQDSIAGDQLANLCNSFREKEDLEDNDKSKAKRWCFKPRKVEDILISKGRKQVYEVIDNLHVWDSQKKKELARQYFENKEEKFKMTTSWDNPILLSLNEGDLAGNLEAFEKACENALEAKSFEKDIDLKIEKAEKWCTVSAEVA